MRQTRVPQLVIGDLLTPPEEGIFHFVQTHANNHFY